MIAIVVTAFVASVVTAVLTVWITYQISLARVKATYLPPSTLDSLLLPDAEAIKAAARLKKLRSTCLCGHMRDSHHVSSPTSCLMYDCYCPKFESQASVTA